MGKTADNKGAAQAAPSMAELLEKALTEAGAPAADIQVLVDFVKSAEATKELLVQADAALEAKENDCIVLRKQLEDQAEELDTARTTVKELQEQLVLAENRAVEAKADEIVIDKETYLVDAGDYNYKGSVVNAATLKKDPELAAELIKLGVGFIKKKGA